MAMSTILDKGHQYSRSNQSGLLGFVLLAGVLALAGPAQAQNAEALSARSGTGTATMRGTVNLGALPQITAAEAAARPRGVSAFHPGVDPATFAAQKAQAAQRRFAASSGAATNPPAIPQSTLETPAASVAFTSTGEAACGNAHPPDQALAVGAGPATGVGSVLQVMNICIDVYDKSGNLQPGFPKSLTAFFGLTFGTYITDPRALYDWINHRYIVAAVFCPNNMTGGDAACATINGGDYAIAVSTADDPTGSYCVYIVSVQSVTANGGNFPFPDYPRLGQDRQAIYLGSNIFFPDTNTFKWEEILAFPKAPLYACSANFSLPFVQDLNVGGTPTDTTQPANVYSAGDQPRSEFFVTSRNIRFGGGGCMMACNGLIVWSWYDPFNTTGVGNKFTGVVVATANNYSLPPHATQPNTSTQIFTGDTRISGSVGYSAGRLYASLNTNGGGGAPGCILYSATPFLNTDGSLASATLTNEIVVFNSGAGFNGWWFCTQQPDPEGNVTTVYSFSSASNFASLGYMTRRSTQPPGTFPDSGFFLLSGQGPYTEVFRWGDYNATSISGLVSGGGTGGFPTFWFSGMYATNSNTWGTAIGRNGYTNPSQD
jgi:hypothetical protein